MTHLRASVHLHVRYTLAQCTSVCSTCYICTNAFAWAQSYHKTGLYMTLLVCESVCVSKLSPGDSHAPSADFLKISRCSAGRVAANAGWETDQRSIIGCVNHCAPKRVSARAHSVCFPFEPATDVPSPQFPLGQLFLSCVCPTVSLSVNALLI